MLVTDLPGMAVEVHGVRLRATVLVTFVFAAALLIGGVVVTSVLRDELTKNLDSTLRTAAADRAALISQGASATSLTNTQLRESFVWIGVEDGVAVAAGGRLELTEPLPRMTAADVGTTRTMTLQVIEAHEGSTEAGSEQLRLAIDSAIDAEAGVVFVVVGSELEIVDRPVARVTKVLLFGGPLLLLLVGGLTWLTADRALRPVELIRLSAERVSDHRHGHSIAVPNSGDEIERLASTLSDMVRRLSRADSRQRQFIADASHELKSPLANLRIDIETSEASTDRRVMHLGQIDRLAAIVDDLLVLAAHDEGHQLDHEFVDLDDIVFDVLAAAAPGHEHVIDFDGVQPTRANGDPSQLRRLVRNLVDNALRHATSQVALTLTAEENLVILGVDDDGDGVPEIHRTSIFERFKRADDSRARLAGGTGLGLAIVKQIVERHGGSVVVGESALGGARFVVTLPTDLDR